MNVWSLIIQLISGVLGGNAAGALMKKLSLGTVLNSILGIIGGGLGGQLLDILHVGTKGGGLDLGGIITSIAGGGIGGGILLVIVGLIKKSLSKSQKD